MGATECVASITASTTGALTRIYALINTTGELRQVDAYVVGGTAADHPVVYHVVSLTTQTPSYTTSYFMNGVVHATNVIISGGTNTASPDPTGVTLVNIPEHSTAGVSVWQYTWPKGEGPVSDPSQSRWVAVAFDLAGAATNTARGGLTLLWEPQGA